MEIFVILWVLLIWWIIFIVIDERRKTDEEKKEYKENQNFININLILILVLISTCIQGYFLYEYLTFKNKISEISNELKKESNNLKENIKTYNVWWQEISEERYQELIWNWDKIREKEIKNSQK
jgi:heme/copper-type cytochrome/quinol oxidase subunit 2